MLIGAGRPRTDRVVPQHRVKRVTLQIGQLIQERPGPACGGQNASDRRQREGAEADGTLEGGSHVVTLVMRHQRQQLLRLQFALHLLGQQTVEELQRDRAKFAEALPQLLGALAGIVGGMMALERLT